MRSSEDVGQDYLYTSQVRLDAGHSPQARDPVLRSRRVKQVLAGASSSHSIRIDRGVEDLSSRLKVCMDGLIDAGQQQCPPGQVLRRFRDNLHTLNHIARDPILCYAEEGAVLSDLRETLYLTESALRQIEMAGRDREVYGTAGESILAIANVIENRVDRLFDRMERLTSLRQSLFRMSGVLGVVACGGVPIVHDVEEIATAVIDAIFEDGQVVTLLDPE